MPTPAEYQPWIDLALAISGARKTGKVSRNSWLYPLLRSIAHDLADYERRERRVTRIG